MAEPPKRPSHQKLPAKPDFSPFEDWLDDGPAGDWPTPWQTDEELSKSQKQIVAANAALLLDREAWRARVVAFEAAIKKLPNEARQKEMRAKHRIRFDRHQFAEGPKDFSSYSFPCSVSFAGASFGEGDVLFSGASFGEGDVRFDGVIFGQGDVSFRATTFSLGDVWFNGAAFNKGSILFERASFGDGDVWFDRTGFGDGIVRFVKTRFGDGNIWFGGAIFGAGMVFFDGALFGDGNVWFDRVFFGADSVSFDEAVFGNGIVGFSGARFGGGNTSFNGTMFGDGVIYFAEVTVGEGNIWFSHVDFRSTFMRASDMVVAGNLHVESNFPMPVDFSRLEVKGTARFSGSSFAIVPDFTDAKFDRPPEVAGMEVPRPKLGRGGSSKLSPLSRALFAEALDGHDVTKYRKLKAMALAANDHEKDGEFFAGEMLAKRGVETTSFAGLLFNTFYWKLSDFGQSFTLPLIWMCRIILVFAVANVVVVQIGAPATLAIISSRFEAMMFSAVLSLKNAIPLLGSLFRFAAAPESHKGWFQTYYDTLKQHTATADWLIGLGVLESIIGGVLLFLFLLALRNKFRLK